MISPVSCSKNIMMSFSYIWDTEILMLNTSVKFHLVDTEVFHIAMQQF